MHLCCIHFSCQVRCSWWGMRSRDEFAMWGGLWWLFLLRHEVSLGKRSMEQSHSHPEQMKPIRDHLSMWFVHVVFDVCISVQVWLLKIVDICCSNMFVVVSCGLVFTCVCCCLFCQCDVLMLSCKYVCYCLLWWVDIICMFVVQLFKWFGSSSCCQPPLLFQPPLFLLLQVFVT